jgi:hypothetical protein
METASGFVDAWIKAQKEFMESWMKAQKEFIESWVKAQSVFMEKWDEATRKIEESFGGAGSRQNSGISETFSLYRSWLKTLADSSKAFADESGRLQETWKDTVEKQMDMTSDMAKNFFEAFQKGR